MSEGRVNNDEIASWNGKGRCARLHAVRVTLHLHDDLVTRILQAEIQSSDAGEERDRLHRAGGERDRGDEASESEAPRVVVVTGLSRWP